MRRAGNNKVTVKVYPGAQHAWETLGPVYYLANAENYSKCSATVEDNGTWTLPVGAPVLPTAELHAWMKAHCMFHWAHVACGTVALKRQATDDIIAFLKRNGF
jgi:hypothetical protein